MAPFVAHVGSCVGTRNVIEWLDDAATGGCQRRCWESIRARPAEAYGRCVAYSVSTSAHEARQCSMWDVYGFTGPAADGHPFRTCHVVALAASPPPASAILVDGYRRYVAHLASIESES